MAEAGDLKSPQCGFESRRGHNAPLPAEPIARVFDAEGRREDGLAPWEGKISRGGYP